MRKALILALIWVIACVFWGQYLLGKWHETVDSNRAQIEALDICERVYPPRADGYAAVYGNSWVVWLANQERDHPDCAPLVSKIALLKFVEMQQGERDALRQNAQAADDLATSTAIRAGWMVPLALLIFIGALVFVFILVLRR
jgi:hypothetical protein